jgi:hypothetical protein
MVPEQARGMKITELIRPPRAPSAPESPPDERGNVPPSASEPPTVGEMLAETVPLADVVAGAGPPVAFLAVPWLLFVLALAGPFALVFTFVVLLVAAALVVVLAGAILATPYLLVRHLRRHRPTRAFSRDRAVKIVPAQSQRARA